MKSRKDESSEGTAVKAMRSALGLNDGDELPRPELTAREVEILPWLAEPGTLEEIAKEHFVACGTLKKHMDNLREKTGCTQRHELVIWAILAGDIQAENPPKDT